MFDSMENTANAFKNVFSAVDRGMLTVNDARKIAGLPPISAAIPIKDKPNVYRLPFVCRNCGGNQYEIKAIGRVFGGNVVLDKHLYICNFCGTTYEKGATICE